MSKHTHTDGNTGVEQMVQIAVDEVQLEGMLELPPHAHSMVLFAHGSGSSRHSPRNIYETVGPM